MAVSERWVRKYMRLAKQFGEDDNRCYSRHIGVVLVHPEHNRILSTGLNGPVQKAPPCDSADYLANVFWPQLTAQEKRTALMQVLGEVSGGFNETYDQALERHKAEFVRKAENCRVCPRRLVGAGSGQRTELCANCEHAERNAVYNASCDLHGAHAYCWCPLPCADCSRAFIRAGITTVWCLANDGPDYSPSSRWLFRQAGIIVHERPAGWYLEGAA